MSITPTTLLVIVFAVSFCTALIWVWTLEKRYRRIFTQTSQGSLDEVLATLVKRTNELRERVIALEQEQQTLDTRIKRAIVVPKTIRFDAWGDTSSNQSFAVGLLTEEGNGVVLSSLYARERTNIYAKPITAWKSNHDLTPEEQETISL